MDKLKHWPSPQMGEITFFRCKEHENKLRSKWMKTLGVKPSVLGATGEKQEIQRKALSGRELERKVDS